MYSKLVQAIDWFSKNIFLSFGNSIVITILYSLVITLAPVFIILYLPVFAWFIYAIFILMMRVNVSLVNRQSIFYNLFYLIPQQIVFLTIIGNDVYNRFTRKLI